MKKKLINQIQTEMSGVLNNAQRQKLSQVLEHCFFNVDVVVLGHQKINTTMEYAIVDQQNEEILIKSTLVSKVSKHLG